MIRNTIQDTLVITDGLINALKDNFGPHHVQYADTWEKCCELKGKLQVIKWLELKQAELRDNLHSEGESKITINME